MMIFSPEEKTAGPRKRRVALRYNLSSMHRTLTVAFIFSFAAWADIRLPALFTDHMVIQRAFPVHVWGRASADESISVTFRGNTKSTTADSIGMWSVYLPPVEPGGPSELTIK